MKVFDSKQVYLLGVVYQLGLAVVVPLVLCIGGGVWIDRKLMTTPKFTLGGIVIGLYLAVYSAYYVLKPVFEVNNRKRIRKEKVE